MLRTVMSAVGALGLVGAAQAADLPERAAPPAPLPAVAPVYSWEGFYFGVHAGVLWSTSDVFFAGGSPFYANLVAAGQRPRELDLEETAFIGGAQAGYNAQLGALVVGLEADLSYVSLDQSASFVGGRVTTTASSEMNLFGTVRARVGYAAGRFMPYVTGGLAYGVVDSSLRFTQGATTSVVSDEDLVAGWTVGGGAEYAVTNAWTVRGEYLYYDLGEQSVLVRNTQGQTATWDFDHRGHIARVGANYKF
jgi:outer membrane immunogenic protein